MNFLSRLVGKADPAPKRITPAARIPTPAGRAASVTPIRSAAPRTAPAPQSYKSASDLPPYLSVASASGGAIKLTEQNRQHLFVLALVEPVGAYCVGASRDYFNSMLYKSVMEQIRESGGMVRHSGIADSALISKLNRGGDDEAAAEEAKPIMRDIDKLVVDAMEEDVSDIHIEARGDGARVRFRIHGQLVDRSDNWDSDYVMQMARALHTMADDESKTPTFVNDASLSVTRDLPNRSKVKLRVQLSPAYPDGAIDIVIRVLKVDAKAKVRSLDELGYAPDHIKMLEYMQSSPHGAIIIAGETGSGKTTTLQTIMHGIWSSSPWQKLISVEDPPEYILEGVTQIPATRRRDKPDANPFEVPLRNALRMDPDVIMVGEIRDGLTAGLMTGAVTSGHKALTTIHTDSGLGIIGRLRSMGVEPDVLGARNFLAGLVYQTLIPILCEHCKVEFENRPDLMSSPLGKRVAHVTKPGDTLFVKSEKGCARCKFTGISGRTVCAEMVVPDNQMRMLILADDMSGAFEYWESLRDAVDEDSMIGRTALDHAILKMRRGIVSPAAVESDLGLLFDFTVEPAMDAEPSALLGLHA